MPDPPSLIAIWFNNPQRNVRTPSISIARYDELRQPTASFSSILGKAQCCNRDFDGITDGAQRRGPGETTPRRPAQRTR
jgi:hypothetical protein